MPFGGRGRWRQDNQGPFGSGQGQAGGRGRYGVGPGGFCVCPSCGMKVAHQRGVPCYSMTCPKCGVRMIRE